ncbi:triose-phosphate isomerase [Actinoplanes bogorensis]|uniref:Triosephosphate isomerase n=1 Tax=Paractinoplanes bogorensis TaxID=1610840 RepID=A0ABS5YSQ2_9ACTN|nr:triose-phosphate isomerase family protein [Actinoplanes bogorensis]MBU2666346.1 triose-phosphate isomerase [Actinoplanes bogorensis]
MRRPEPGPARTFLAVSLKMYFDPARTLEWTAGVAELARTHPAVTGGHVDLVVLPSLPVLGSVVELLAGTGVAVGAQDLFHLDRGAYTGAVSGADLRQLGCAYAEVGHFERRTIFGEDDRMIRRKMVAARRNDLIPLLCVGESRAVSVDEAVSECVGQLEAAVGRDDIPLVVAYEPTWAIGAAEPAGPTHVKAVTAEIRAWLGDRDARVIYGGSAGNGLLTELDGAVDGLFLGRSAHRVPALRSILDETRGVR